MTCRTSILRIVSCVTVIPLIPHHPGRRWQVFEHPISTSEVTALSLTQVEPQGTIFAVADPMERAGYAPPGATSQGGHSPLLRLDAVGWAVRSVASIIKTSGSGESGGSGASDPAAAAVVVGFVGAIGGRGIHPAQPLLNDLNDMDDAASTPSCHLPLHTTSLGNEGRMQATCSALSPNNWAIAHLLLVLSWGSLSGERIIPHIMGPDPRPGLS